MADTISIREQMMFDLSFDEHLEGMPPLEMVEKASKKIFDFDYPIFDESYRNVLNIKITKALWLHQIAFSGWGEFKWQLNEFMNRRMPYYNRLYQSQIWNDYNPIDDIDYTDNRTVGAKKHQQEKGSNDYLANNHSHGTSDTSDSSETNGKTNGNVKGTTHGTSDTTTHSEENGTSDVKNSGTKNDRKTVLDPPQSAVEMTKDYANTVNIDNENHDDDTKTTSNVTTDGTSKTTNDGTSTQDTTGSSNTTANGKSETITDAKATSKSKGHNQREGNIVSTEDYIFHRAGRNGTHMRGELVKAQRENIIDIDTKLVQDIIKNFQFALY